MPNNEQELTTLTEKLVNAVREYGLVDASIDEYQITCNSIIRFAENHGLKDYSQDLIALYANEIDKRVGSGECCKEYGRFKRRVLRMLSSLAETGEVDFSKAPSQSTKYHVSDDSLKLVEDILNSQHISEKTRSDLRAPIRHLFWYAEEHGKSPHTLDDEAVMMFIIDEIPRTNGGSTGRTLRCVKYVTEYLKENGNTHITHDYRKLTLKNDKRMIIPSFSEEEIKSMSEAIDTSTPLGKRDYAIILMAYCTGLRGADLLLIKLADIDWKKERVSVVQSKTHTPVVAALNGATLNAIADYILEARPECDVPEVFVTTRRPFRALACNLGQMIDKYCEKAGVKKIHFRAFHSLRRAFETVMVSNGVPIEIASQMMGHRGISEDKPYITHDKEKVAFVALGFDDVPIRNGLYAGIGSHLPDQKGGDAQ